MANDARLEDRTELANRMRPAVIVGLGGTGKEIVALIREYLIDQYGSLDAIPIVSFVVIDTDPADAEAQSRCANPREVQLDSDEWVFASIPDIGVIWREWDNLPHLRDWLPPNLEGLGDVSQGAKQIRALGRLAFYNNFDRIRNALRAARDKVINPDHAATLSAREIEIDPDFQNNPEYYLVSSLAGGTGAGMFLDVAFLIKSFDHQHDESPVVAFLAMPDVFADKTVGRVNPNAYAALKELNYFTYNARDPETGEYLDQRYNDNHPWEVQYTEGGTPVAADPPPFRYCYLVGMQNDAVTFTPDTRTDFFEMLAHNIVLDFTSVFGAYKRSARDNPGEGFLEPDARGLPQSFCSFGLSSLRFPRKAVLNACACKLCERVACLWHGELTGEPTQPMIDNAVAQFMEEELRLGRAEGAEVVQVMARWLGTSGEGESLFARMESWRQRVSDRILRERPSAEEICTQLRRATEELQEGVYDDGSADASRWGPWLRRMQQNVDRQLGQSRDQIVSKVEELLDAAYGPAGVARFLEKLSNRLAAIRTDLGKQTEDEGQLRAHIERSRARTQAQLQRIDAIAHTFVFDKRMVIVSEAEKYLALARSHYQAQLGRKAADFGGRLLSALLSSIEQLQNDVEELEALLSDLERRFRSSHEDWGARASSQMVNGISLYERRGTIEECYDRDVPSDQELGTARSLGNAVLSDLETRLLGITRVPRIDLRETLFGRAAKEYFPRVEEVSAAEILAGKSQGEIERLLRTVHDRSSPFLHLIRQTPGYYPEQTIRTYFVGIHGGVESPDRHVQEILPSLRELPGVRGNIHALPDSSKDEILIGQETYTFPLRAVGTMEDLQAHYKRYLEPERRLPIHVHRDWDEILPDHVPVAPEVEREARMASAVGLALALVRPAESNPDVWVYEYTGESGLPDTAELTKQPDFSLLWRRLAEDAEVRGYLIEDIEATVAAAESDEDKKAMHARLSHYLDNLAQRYERTLVPYREQHREISEFITRYGLAVQH